MVHHQRRPALYSAQLGVTCHTPPGASAPLFSALSRALGLKLARLALESR